MSLPVILPLSAVVPRAVEWLWPNRIPLRSVTLLSGDPGLGKSFVTMDIAARITRGGEWPNSEDHAPLGSVVLLDAENLLDEDIAPRLLAAGANLNKVFYIDAVTDQKVVNDVERPLSLDNDISAIESVLEQVGDVRLIIIDPISAYMGRIDSHNNTQVRGVMAPLSKLTQKYNVAILAINHLNKGESPKALYRSGGSIAFIAAARCALTVTQDKDNKDRRLLIPSKNNRGRTATGLGFSLVEESGGEDAVARVYWDDMPVELDADEAMSDDESVGLKLRQAKEWLTGFLKEGPRPSKDIETAAVACSISARTLRRARETLNLDVQKTANCWTWGLPTGE